jgi:hypothetical protein
MQEGRRPTGRLRKVPWKGVRFVAMKRKKDMEMTRDGTLSGR